MKPVGILYATREGHTQRVAEHIAAVLRSAGLEASTWNLRIHAEQVDLAAFDAVILAASVRAGSHEPEMIEFVQKHRAHLDRLPNAFLSVSLSQVGAEDPVRSAEQRAPFAADVESMIAQFRRQTGWDPHMVKPVAGALLYSKYNFFIRFIMKRIARKAGAPTDTSRDYEFTNWLDLEEFARQFASAISPRVGGIAHAGERR
jgi:menaquinone-dependent protoporphyrinogen oxidase